MPRFHNHSHYHHSHAPEVSGANECKILLFFFLIFQLYDRRGDRWPGLRLFGRKAADTKRTFGYLHFEVIAGFINAITLFLIVGWILFEAWERFSEPQPVLAGPMMAVAIAGLVVNILVFWILPRDDSEHVNIKGAALHVLGDLLGSIGAVAAAVIIHFTGWTPIDPILSVVVSLLILRSAWALLAKSLYILLEGAPDNATPGRALAS
ncbi:cation diffusion facilitator family transporter [Oceanospirillum maris]|uniref:cation diffusion facilitator family transporter n=1 Tax=Oceanospirillum maris TaxID=64977 RepID=UPI0004254A7E|nr:cation diffusion facilitator family transporter [Oceanospirillum maris]